MVTKTEIPHELRYVNADEPGIRRKRAGKGFTYLAPDGSRITDPDVLNRIRSLGVPPAYREVWICLTPDGHIQATGRDEKGRKQYRYHPRWNELRDQTKFDRMIAFGEALPTIRERVQQDLALPGMPREKILATVVELLGTTFIRIGNEEYARHNESFGLTTMQDEHVAVEGSKVHFEFRGKSGKEHVIDLKDRRLAKIIKKSQDLPGEHLFQYKDADGTVRAITSSDVNAYLREITGQDFTAKDFRTWGGTTLALLALTGIDPAENKGALRKNLSAMVKEVSGQLGNTTTVCRKYYIHPRVLEAYGEGKLAPFAGEVPPGLRPAEAALLTLLRETS
ncbi:MAG: DNA topoisomerase IB [Anaerolineae bacterium]|nr:DNA topoisomerase IB [Anaerolineae bacterium]